jgi:hypothetical protein
MLEITRDPPQQRSRSRATGCIKYRCKLCAPRRRSQNPIASNPGAGGLGGFRNGGVVEKWRLGCKLMIRAFLNQMPDPISAQVLPDELFLEIFIHSVSDYGLIDDFLASVGVQRLTLPCHAQFPPLEEWKRRTQTLLYLSRVSKSWFRVATPLLYENIRIYRPMMVFALIRASSEAPVLLEHTKHLSFEIDYSGDAPETDESSPNPSQAFQKLASRCPNLCVVQNCRPELGGDQHPNVFPSLRLYEGLLQHHVLSSPTNLQYLILHDIGAPLSHNLQGLSFPLLHVLDLTRTDWINYPIIMSWELPTLSDLRGRFHQQRVSYDIIAKVAKTLSRLQIQISNLDDSWGLSGSDIDAPIPLPRLSEVTLRIDDGVSVGLHPRFFTAFRSLDSLRLITMNIPGNMKAFIMTLVAFIRIFEGPTTPQSLTIRIGEASLKPRMSEWFGCYQFTTIRNLLHHLVHRLSNYGAILHFAMPNGTYDTLHWFDYECQNYRVRITKYSGIKHDLLKGHSDVRTAFGTRPTTRPEANTLFSLISSTDV